MLLTGLLDDLPHQRGLLRLDAALGNPYLDITGAHAPLLRAHASAVAAVYLAT